MGATASPPPASGAAAPGRRVLRCHSPAQRVQWGWVAQLYSLRSRTSWGIGDLEDLRRLGLWAAGQGAALVMINPLHAALPGVPQEPSPYFPSSRLFRNLLYLHVEDVPGAENVPVIAKLATQARALNDAAVVDRDSAYTLKLQALETLWERFTGDRRFDAYCEAEGQTLEKYATFCVLAEKHAGPWS